MYLRVEADLVGLRLSILVGGTPLWLEAKFGGWRQSLEVGRSGAWTQSLEAQLGYKIITYMSILFRKRIGGRVWCDHEE
jgi:hypothetical protein